MKKQYKEIRRIFACDLRQLCVEKDWYTAGDNDEYKHLLFDLASDKENITTADIIEIAEDIMEHSEMEPDCTIEGIALEVARIAVVVRFAEVKGNSCSQKQLANADAEQVTRLESEIEQLKSDIELLSSALENERAVTKELKEQLERQTLTDDELTDVKRMAVDKRLALENEVKNAAERIVETADEPESAAFQNAVKDHRTAQEELEYCTDLLKKLTEIGEQ